MDTNTKWITYFQVMSMVTGLQSGDVVLCVITTSQCTQGEWNPVFPKFIFNAKRTENIEEDAKFYKEISGLKVNASGKKNIEHGNSNVRRCKFLQNNFLLYQISEFIHFNKNIPCFFSYIKAILGSGQWRKHF